ncbi:MAG: NAD-dependent epimerase/dehydratase family protein [Devosia nanyangense]|uniref:NAD-dependent epimerase/dehydratase family protein n=1 Tax=Devosia nanyangense TaxID=1228055 RepID=A0A933P0F7_9HYPH|nr:NAD-dependent epimerase/dehydratase family protein [Devosia nanyangense]
MSKGKVVVLGVNGHVGRHAAEAFAAAGWDVTGMGRSDKHHLMGVRFVQGDAENIEDMRRAVGDAEIVVNALNLRYDSWFNGRMEAQMARVLTAIGTTGKTMLFPGNIYNFAADNAVLTPDVPQLPATPRGGVRVRVEQMFRDAAARGDLQVIVLRAGDFYGPRSSGDWFDQIMFRDIARRKVSIVGARGVGHSWAYLPDLGRAFEALAALRSTLGAFETFHFAGHFVTPEQMGEAIAKASSVPLRISAFPWLLLRFLGLVDPVVRAVAKMGYIWRNPLELRDARLDELLGEGFGTPFAQAVAATVVPLLDPLVGSSTSGAPATRTA